MLVTSTQNTIIHARLLIPATLLTHAAVERRSILLSASYGDTSIARLRAAPLCIDNPSQGRRKQAPLLTQLCNHVTRRAQTAACLRPSTRTLGAVTAPVMCWRASTSTSPSQAPTRTPLLRHSPASRKCATRASMFTWGEEVACLRLKYTLIRGCF
jgi:hypothetical protein